MGDIDPGLIDRIQRFLDHYGETPQPVCMECLTEFSEGIRRCSDCGSPLVAGPRAVAELRVLLEKGRAQQRATGSPPRGPNPPAADVSTDDEPPPTPEGALCPRCGTPFDPDVDVEGCETCRQAMLHASEEAEGPTLPDAAELAHAERLRRFLGGDYPPEHRFCPGCFEEFVADVTSCAKCAKELLELEVARLHARRALSDLTASWFTALLDDANSAFATRVLDALESAEDAPPIELRVHREARDFSPIFAVWRSYRSTYFVRQYQVPALREWLSGQDFGKEHADALAELVERLRTGE